MTHHFEPVLPLVRAAGIEPAGCLRAALAMAELHDANGGLLKASMASLGALAGLSTQQVRKHVHSLIKRGLLEVTANAHGGAPGSVPHYRFNLPLLRAQALQLGQTPDMFSVSAPPRLRFYAVAAQDLLLQMAIELRGQPGHRTVHFFWETNRGDVAYGWGPLQALLAPSFCKGAWTGQLHPHPGAIAGAGPVSVDAETSDVLRRWAQDVALGRAESEQSSNNQPALPQGADDSDH